MFIRSWRNTDEYNAAHAEMASKGMVQTGSYGGIGPFGGSEVGIFEDADPAKRTPPKCCCKPWDAKWQAGYRVAGYLVCGRCEGRIE